jgi:hypothetical protein
MLIKDKVIKSLNEMPDKFTIDEFIERLMLINKIETGQEQSRNNQTISDDDLDKKLNEWFG